MGLIIMTFEMPEDKRADFIDNVILKHFPEEERDPLRERVKSIAIDFDGRDLDALSVIAYAAEKGRFEEFAGKLESHSEESLRYVHPEARRLTGVPGARRAEQFFLNCYKELEVQPRQ